MSMKVQPILVTILSLTFVAPGAGCLSPPDAPTGLAVSPGDGSLEIEWEPAERATTYELWYATRDDLAAAGRIGTDLIESRSTLTGLVNGNTYHVWVRARNAAGESDFSESAGGTPSAQARLPDVPERPTVLPGDSLLIVSWEQVHGASTYEVRLSAEEDVSSALPAAETEGMAVALTELTNGTTYHVWVRAEGSAGKSDFSLPASGTPRPAPVPPEAPSRPVVEAGDETLFVEWAPVEGAAAYDVWYHTQNSVSVAERLEGHVDTPAAPISGLENGSTYHVWVRAKNEAGVSDFSEPGSGIPRPEPAPPPAPVRPTAAPRDGLLLISWEPVKQAAAYEVWYHTEDEPAAADRLGGAIPGVSCSIAGLENGTTYHVWVRATNSSGAGGFSPPALGIPMGTPAAPEVTLVGEDVFVTWVAVVGAESYQVLHSHEEGSEWLVSADDIDGTSIEFHELERDRTHRFRVLGKNAGGEGEPSPEAGIYLPAAEN